MQSYKFNCTGEEKRLVDCRNQSLISRDESCEGRVEIGCWNISTHTRQPTATAVMMPSRDSSPVQLVSTTMTILTSSHMYRGGQISYTSPQLTASSHPPGTKTSGVCWQSGVYGSVAGGVAGGGMVGAVILVLYITWRRRHGHSCTPRPAG